MRFPSGRHDAARLPPATYGIQVLRAEARMTLTPLPVNHVELAPIRADGHRGATPRANDLPNAGGEITSG
jgi:hypothetical protein